MRYRKGKNGKHVPCVTTAQKRAVADQPKTEPPVEGTNFLDLPREIRDMIHELVLGDKAILLCTGLGQRDNCPRYGVPRLRDVYNLINASRQVRLEMQEAITDPGRFLTILGAADPVNLNKPVCAACSKISPFITQVRIHHRLEDFGNSSSLQRGRNGQGWTLKHAEELDGTFSVNGCYYPTALEVMPYLMNQVVESMGSKPGVSPQILERIERVPMDVHQAWYGMRCLAYMAALRAKMGKEVPEKKLKELLREWRKR